MSWFSRILQIAVPFVADVAETRDVKASGEKLFDGLAKRLKEVAHDPNKVRELAETLEAKKGELTGSIVANTPAAQFMDREYMPPDAVQMPPGPEEE